ncbi:helix-turn-helix domain-containing protein [Halorubrum sp. Boch-26]|uniref:helix-turn-helix transcriptional regulator n=1 Tax=Halorubrum sp. Boch-26 TaxID=2994426 RepID=UPI0024694BF1|nr:helix-turn-helix domain-containing protein [Halorubrum sp. Boch-26]
MRRRGRTVKAVAALLVAVCCVAAVAFAAPVGAQTTGFPQADDQPDPDNTITRIDLAADGSAAWEITLRTRLRNDSDVAEYERFQERFRSNTSRYLDPFADRMTGVVAAANESFDREMRAADFAAETGVQEVPRRWGVVRFRFTWTGFAAVEGDAVVVGDVFDGGFFIGDDDALVIGAPEGYAVDEAAPTPDSTGNGAVEWQGREDFDDGRPSVRAVPASAGDGASDGGGDDGGAGDGPPVAALVVALVIAALVVAAYAARGDRIALGSPGRDDDSAGGAAAAPSIGEAGTEKASPRSAGGDGTAGAASGAGATGADDASEGDAVDPDLLTDEDRVRRALRERGGRMRQSAVVDALGWSKSKTSRVLSRMTDDGEVEKLRIGRENVIDLVEDDGDE